MVDGKRTNGSNSVLDGWDSPSTEHKHGSKQHDHRNHCLRCGSIKVNTESRLSETRIRSGQLIIGASYVNILTRCRVGFKLGARHESLAFPSQCFLRGYSKRDSEIYVDGRTVSLIL